MKFLSQSKNFVTVLALGVLFSAGISFAAWKTDTWHEVDSWVKDGEAISAKKIAENFNYLYARASTTLSTNSMVTLNANSIGYNGPSTAYGYSFAGASTASADDVGVCFLTTNFGADVRDYRTFNGGCTLSSSGSTWTLKAIADARHSTKCQAVCLRSN